MKPKKVLTAVLVIFPLTATPLVGQSQAALNRLGPSDLDVSGLQGSINYLLMNTLHGIIEVPNINPICLDIADLLGLSWICESFSLCVGISGGELHLPPNQTFMVFWEDLGGGDWVINFMIKTNRANFNTESSLDINCLLGLIDINVPLTSGDFSSGPNKLSVRARAFRNTADNKIYLYWANSDAFFLNVQITTGILPPEWEDWLIGWLNPGIAAVMSMLFNSFVLQDHGPLFNLYDSAIRNYQPPPQCALIPGESAGDHLAGLLLYLVPAAFLVGMKRRYRH